MFGPTIITESFVLIVRAINNGILQSYRLRFYNLHGNLTYPPSNGHIFGLP